MSMIADCFGKARTSADDRKELRRLAKEYEKNGLDRETSMRRAAADIMDSVTDDVETLRESVKAAGYDVSAKTVGVPQLIPKQARQGQMDAPQSEPQALKPGQAADSYQVRDLAQEARDMVRADVPLPDQKYADESNLNLQRIEAPEDIRAALNRVSLLNAPIIAEETRGKVTQEQTAALASDLGMTVEQLLARRTGAAFNAEEVLAARQMLGASSVELMKLAKMASGQQATDQSRADFRKYLETHAAIQAEVAGLTAEAGRALAIFRRKVSVGETALDIGDVQSVIDAAGGHGNIDRIATALMNLGELAADGKVDVRQINKFVRDARKATTWDMIQEAWINSLLMQPATHIVNSASNSIVAAWAMPERFVAGAIGAVRSRIPGLETGEDRVYMGEALAQAYGGFNGFMDGLRIAWGTFKSGESADPMGKVEYTRRAITSESLGIDPADPFGKALDLIATWTTGSPAGAGSRQAARAIQKGLDTTLDFTVRGPTRALMAEDDLFKTVGYRMEVRAQAYRTASGEGLSGKAFSERVQELTDNPPASIRLAGIEAARYQTYTNDLGDIGNAVMRMRGATHEIKMRDGSSVDVPIGAPLTVIIPFVRTPLNVIKYGISRTPAAVAMPSFWSDVAAGGAKADLAIARVTLGSMLGAFAAQLGASGVITGSGPTDPKQRENLQAVGWQPYSVKIGETYYQYKRLDPFSTILGLGADFAQMHEWMDNNEREDAAKLIATSIAQNVLDKTFMTGVHGFFDAISDPQRYGDRWLQRTASSFVPASGGLRALRNYNDPYLREVEGVMDSIKNTLPGYSKTLYPKLDRYGRPIDNGEYWLAMQGVSPVRTSKEPDYRSDTGAIDYVISENKISIPQMSRTMWVDGVKVKLTTDEYNRLQDISGNEVGLIEKLHDLVGSPQFESMSGGPNGTKSSAIRQIFDIAHQHARYLLQKETEGIPDGLDERIREAREIARINNHGQ